MSQATFMLRGASVGGMNILWKVAFLIPPLLLQGGTKGGLNQAIFMLRGAACGMNIPTKACPREGGGWNPEKLLILWALLDSSFRWNDEVWCIFSILGQTFRQDSGQVKSAYMSHHNVRVAM